MQPREQTSRFAVGARARFGGPAAHLYEQFLFLCGWFAEERCRGFQRVGMSLFQLVVVIGLFLGLLHLSAQDAHGGLEGWSVSAAWRLPAILVLSQGNGEGFRRRKEAFLEQFQHKFGGIAFNLVAGFLQARMGVCLQEVVGGTLIRAVMLPRWGPVRALGSAACHPSAAAIRI